MKLYIYFSITAVVLICTKTVMAEKQQRDSHSAGHELSDMLNSNSIYRNNEATSVQKRREQSLFNNLHKDTVVVKDANGNVQQSTKVYMSNGSKFNTDNSLYFMFVLVTYILSAFN
ncbi:uncharacterized protein LOC135952202 [Calliphora vicina]|uniref:uncharacterized protein LOC135952202 n=1 Tax=Calliphora vicina TaxID=7373 RepID=UPI00325C093E